MPYPTTTKFFASDAPGAPTVYADAGGVVGWLDTLLVNGYGAAVLTQIVVTDGVAVATTALGHSLRKWMVALHEGTGNPALDGEHRVIAAAGASYTFEVTGVPNGTYTGGSTKVAPLGFEISYSATNRRIYRSKDTVQRNAVSLYVDDTNTVTGWNIGTNKSLAQVKMVCDVVSIDSYTTLDTTWWFKSAATSGTLSRPWLLAGDPLGFYSAVDVASNGICIASNHFMQLNTLAAGDKFATMLEGVAPNGGVPTANAAGLGAAGACMNAMTHGTRRVARALSQSGAALNLRFLGLGVMAQNSSPPYGWNVSGGNVTGVGYQYYGLSPVNPADAGLVLGQSIIAIHSPTSAAAAADCTGRAVLPGLYSVPAVATWSMTATILEAPAGLVGSNLLALPASVGGRLIDDTYAQTSAWVGGYYVDITKGWR